MKITIDTQHKTIQIIEPITVEELTKELKELVGEKIGEYKITPKIEWFETPAYPTYPVYPSPIYPNQPYITRYDYIMTTTDITKTKQ